MTGESKSDDRGHTHTVAWDGRLRGWMATSKLHDIRLQLPVQVSCKYFPFIVAMRTKSKSECMRT